MRRIIHFACVAPPEIGGIGRVASEEVSRLRARGYGAELLAPDGGSEERIAPRSFVTRLTPRVRVGNASILPLDMTALRRADILHVHYPFYGTAEWILAHAHSLPPIVMTFHMDADATDWRRWAFEMHRIILQPWLLARAQRIIVSSLDYARASSLRGFARRYPERIEEIPFGVDADLFSPGPSMKKRFMVPEDAPVVSFVGGMDRAHDFKGLPELLRAFAPIQTAHLLCVGDGDMRAVYQEEARRLGMSARVHFLGSLDFQSVIEVLRSSQVFAFPSKHRAEAFGLAALEAAACGLPVIASALPGVRTVVRHGETGWLVPPGDVDALSAALGRALEDPVGCAAFGVRARERVLERYTWDRHLDQLIDVYQQICASPS